MDGDPAPAVEMAKKLVKIYPLDRPQDRDTTFFVNSSGKFHNTIHANDIDFYREVSEVIDEEPASAFSPELLGLLAAIGIEKGRPFEPQARMRKTLEEAASSRLYTGSFLSYGWAPPRTNAFMRSAANAAIPNPIQPPMENPQ